MTKPLTEIKYKNKIVDQGLILSQRKYRWCLKRQYEPCWALFEGKFITELSPQKTNFYVYIPATELKAGMIITIRNKTEQGKVLIESINKNTINLKSVID